VERALTELGFERKMYRHVRGFIVVPRSGDEITGFQRTLAIQAIKDSLYEEGTDETDGTAVF